jgi:hypothetical protein
MAADFQGDHRVAISARSRLSPSRNTDLLAGNNALGQLEFNRLAIAQRDPLRRQRGRVGKGNKMFISDICAACRLCLLGTSATTRSGTAARTGTSTAAAKNTVKNIAQIDSAAAKIKCGTSRTGAAAAKIIAAIAERRAGLAIFVDFPTVILTTLFGVRQ